MHALAKALFGLELRLWVNLEGGQCVQSRFELKERVIKENMKWE